MKDLKPIILKVDVEVNFVKFNLSLWQAIKIRVLGKEVANRLIDNLFTTHAREDRKQPLHPQGESTFFEQTAPHGGE